MITHNKYEVYFQTDNIISIEQMYCTSNDVQSRKVSDGNKQRKNKKYEKECEKEEERCNP